MTALDEICSVVLEQFCEKPSLRVSGNNYCQFSEHVMV